MTRESQLVAFCEKHRVAYVARLQRLRKAYSLSESVRAENGELLETLITECEYHRMQATQTTKREADRRWGPVSDVARGVLRGWPKEFREVMA